MEDLATRTSFDFSKIDQNSNLKSQKSELNKIRDEVNIFGLGQFRQNGISKNG